MEQMSKKIKDENKILIMLAFYSIAIGLWENFRQLWLETNQFDVSQISQILSFATLVCAIGILFVGKKITTKNIKTFILYSLIIKTINMLILFYTNNSSYLGIMRFSIIIDVVLQQLIVISIYPLICTIKKDDNLYSKRKLIEYLFKDIGILIGGFFIGRIIFGYFIDYNACLLISVIFSVLATVALLFTKQNNINNEENARR